MRSIGGGPATGYAADQIGHLVIKPVPQEGVRVFGNGLADDARLRDARQPGGLSEPGFSSSVKANAFHAISVSRPGGKKYYKAAFVRPASETCSTDGKEEHDESRTNQHDSDKPSRKA